MNVELGATPTECCSRPHGLPCGTVSLVPEQVSYESARRWHCRLCGLMLTTGTGKLRLKIALSKVERQGKGLVACRSRHDGVQDTLHVLVDLDEDSSTTDSRSSVLARPVLPSCHWSAGGIFCGSKRTKRTAAQVKFSVG
jgi:hypothetical protein